MGKVVALAADEVLAAVAEATTEMVVIISRSIMTVGEGVASSAERSGVTGPAVCKGSRGGIVSIESQYVSSGLSGEVQANTFALSANPSDHTWTSLFVLGQRNMRLPPGFSGMGVGTSSETRARTDLFFPSRNVKAKRLKRWVLKGSPAGMVEYVRELEMGMKAEVFRDRSSEAGEVWSLGRGGNPNCPATSQDFRYNQDLRMRETVYRL